MSDSQRLFAEFNSQFSPDDFDRISIKYFGKLRDGDIMSSDPSGWMNTVPDVAGTMKFNKDELVPYFSDYKKQLGGTKERILRLVASWDNVDYDYDNITLCHSVTVGTAIAISALKKTGIKNIIFETPAYFSTIHQAQDMGMNTLLIPTYMSDNFSFNIPDDIIKQLSPCAIFITQPRTSLGYNQSPQNVEAICQQLSPKDFLIVDEASEQFFPSVLSSISAHAFKNLIKIRSFVKGMGLNGIRLSVIIHSKELRPAIQNQMEIFQGAIDYNSLSLIYEIAANIENFKIMLRIANSQVVELSRATLFPMAGPI